MCKRFLVMLRRHVRETRRRDQEKHFIAGMQLVGDILAFIRANNDALARAEAEWRSANAR